MPTLSQTLLACAFAPIAFATPVKRGGPKNFSFQQSTTKPKLAGPLSVAKTYAKYGKPVPEDVQKAVNVILADGTVTASPDGGDEEYLCPVTIGGQTLNLDFDTGSADLWVFSSELSASARSGHSIYTPSQSSTSKKLSGYTWSITYGDQSSASGDVYTDNVSVGQTTVTAQAVEAAQTVSAEFTQSVNNDGLLGLAFSSINTVSPKSQLTFFDHAIQEGLLQSQVFTANLFKGKAGTYDFGFIDDSKHTGSITYTPISSAQGFWEFSGTGYAVGTGSFKSSSIDAIMDTGTTLIYLPSNIVSAYYSQVSGAAYSSTYGGYTFRCSTTLPNLTLGIGSYHAVVPGSYINYAPVTQGSSTCFGGVQSNSGIGISIYGDVFLKSQFVVFDKAGNRVGVAPKTIPS
ncbi:MAG: hypothetical protein Q9227_009001 [Pyrenula ochraceoflavens]